MTPIAPQQLDEALNWRYATKAFDPSRTIPADVWAALERSLVLTPSSFGLQPWKFLVITDKALREQLRPASWNQSQVTDCSHHVVFLGRTEMREADVQRLIDASAATRGIPAASLDGYKNMMLKDVVHGPRGKIAAEWSARQCYIALGQFMLACAQLGVDACPMEGFEPARYDEILGLAGTGYRSVVACPVGYRAAGDKYATLKKVRFPLAEVVERR
ncbi:MAG: NAD(P)H-dependent oxidoreductase [Planctomycetes bacterium]|nr:NAD(P)H-dependent oxidoreductase [Planctomycetota bacterium]